MRRIACLLLAFCMLLPGCGDTLPQTAVDAGELLAAIEKSQEALPPARLLLREDKPGSASASASADASAAASSCLTPALMERLYAAEEGLPAAASRLGDGRIRLSDALCGCEVHILRGSFAEDTLPLLRLLQRRLELLQTRELHLFLGEEYERYVFTGRTYEKDGWVFLLLLPDPAAAIEAIEEVLR